MRKHKIIWLVILILEMIVTNIVGCGQTAKDFSNKEILKPDKTIEVKAKIADVYGNANAIVTIISDDGHYNSCVNLNKLFSDRKLRCTVAGTVRTILPYQKEWINLLRKGTIDIVSHSYNHLCMQEGTKAAQNIDALRHEIVDADKWYEDWLGYEQIVFVCPNNAMCRNGYKILEDNGFWAVRRGTRGFNSLTPEEGVEAGQWSNLMVKGICDLRVDKSVRNKWIDTAINDRTWLIEMWHDVMPKHNGRYQTILIPDAGEHLNYVAKKAAANDIWVATFTEAVKYLREKQNSTVESYIKNNKLYIFVKLTNAKMSYETFNQPLTVLVNLPNGYKVNLTEHTIVKNDVLSVNVVPGKELMIDLVGK